MRRSKQRGSRFDAASAMLVGIWYHMNQFYSDRDLSVSYTWVSTASVLAQVLILQCLSLTRHLCSAMCAYRACRASMSSRGRDQHTVLTHSSASHHGQRNIVQVAGAPIAAMLLSLNGVLGLRGWKWLFLLEGLPTIAFGFILRVR